MKKLTQQRKSIFMCLAMVVIVAVACSMTLNFILLSSAEAKEEGVYSAAVPADDSQIMQYLSQAESLKTIVDYNGQKVPEQGIAPSYAIAAVAEGSERVFGKTLSGYVYAILEPRYDENAEGVQKEYQESERRKWCISADVVGGGAVHGQIDLFTGEILNLSYSDLASMDQEWFDNWDAAAEEQAKIGLMKELVAEWEKRGFNNFANEELRAEYKANIEERIQQSLKLQESTKDDPRNMQAIKFVDAHDLGNGSNAVSSAIVYSGAIALQEEGVSQYADESQVEVLLENGTYITLGMQEETNEVIRFSISEESYVEAMRTELAQL